MTAPSTPASGAPLVSIVLAVSNGWDETFRLLLALVGSTGATATETIVVDDGSTDETSLALPRLPGLRLHRNERPLGLATARQQGAAMARGRVVFVAPGLVPGPGWLERRLEGAVAQAPRFSVMVPSYNQAGYLPATLASLRAQTRTDWEAVVVDDGSTDDTPRVLAGLAAADPRLRVFRQANGGVAAALNEALRQARGEWICWLSSDDLFEPDALETFAGGAASHPECRFFHADFSYLFEETGRKAATVDDRHVPARAVQAVGLLRDNPINGISVCVHRSVFERVGAFDARFRYGQDVDMWLRACAVFPYVRLRHHVCTTRVHRQMGTAGFPQAGPYDVARACLEFLNAHRYPALFPSLDLGRLDDVVTALEGTFQVVAAGDALMYRGVGPVTALLDRLQEWFSGDCPPAFRAPVAQAIGPLADRLRAQRVPEVLVSALERLRDPDPAPFRYAPVDPVAEMTARLGRLEAAGEPEAGPLRRYLTMIGAAGPGSAAAAPPGSAAPPPPPRARRPSGG